MSLTPESLPVFIQEMTDAIEKNADEVTSLDQEIGDGDHVFNLRRGLSALNDQSAELAQLDWLSAWQKIGMILMSTVGGASGSLYGTLFIAMSKSAAGKSPLNLKKFAEIFSQGVDAVKKRGKAEAGEKTLLDVLIPVANYLCDMDQDAMTSASFHTLSLVALQAMESTRNMIATKGRAAYLGERSRGHIDAGARTCQLMICAILEILSNDLKSVQISPAQ